MTALCGGGPSESRPGFNGGVYLGAQGIGLLLRTFVPEPIADAIAAIVSADALDLTTFCTTDPPSMPTPGPLDFVALLNPSDFVEYDRVRKLAIQWWESIYWHQACQCSLVATPPLPPVTQWPDGGQNSGLPSGGTGNCFETTAGYVATGASSGVIQTDITAAFLPQSSDTISVTLDFGFGAFPIRAVRIPTGVTALVAHSHNRGATSPTAVNAHDGSIHAWSAAGADMGGLAQIFTSQDADAGTDARGTPITASMQYIGIGVVNRFDTSVAGKVMSWQNDIQYLCGAGLETPCCPPDPKLEFKIDQLTQLVLNLNQQAPAGVVGGWTDGVRHTGLEKAGSFHIAAAAIGVRWEFATIPAFIQVSPGNPNFYWDLGFWSGYANGSPLRGSRLVFNPESFHLPEFTDQIGYTLADGVIANAVELIPTTP